MKLAKIPDEEAVALLRALGLLIGQAGIYGPNHNVTQNAARQTFPELQAAIERHGAIEITLREKKLIVNGGVLDVGGSSGRNLLDRMLLHKVEGVAFLPPPDLDEFLRCITLFGTPPTVLAAEGGFEEAMKRADLRSVQVVNVTYRRVSKERAAAEKPEGEAPAKPRAARRPSAAALRDTLDAAAVPDPVRDAEVAAVEQTAREAGRQVALARRQRAVAMAELLRRAASMLEQEDAIDDASRQKHIMGTVTEIRDMLARMSTDSESQIQSFAGRVHADRKTIADIESAARRRGIGLNLTRGELIEHYAELCQELAQPLTVSTGVIDLLTSGRAGPLNDSQTELLKMATESVERVGRLVSHLKRISGSPENLTPDERILREAYADPTPPPAENS
jgi:hypothetical protein